MSNCIQLQLFQSSPPNIFKVLSNLFARLFQGFSKLFRDIIILKDIRIFKVFKVLAFSKALPPIICKAISRLSARLYIGYLQGLGFFKFSRFYKFFQKSVGTSSKLFLGLLEPKSIDHTWTPWHFYSPLAISTFAVFGLLT